MACTSSPPPPGPRQAATRATSVTPRSQSRTRSSPRRTPGSGRAPGRHTTAAEAGQRPDLRRLRVGRYRVLYEITEESVAVRHIEPFGQITLRNPAAGLDHPDQRGAVVHLGRQLITGQPGVLAGRP